MKTVPMRSAKNDLRNTIQSQGILENKYLSRHLDAAIPLRSADMDLKKTIELQHTTVEHIAVMHRFQCTKYFNTCKLPKHCNTLQYLQYNTSLLCTSANAQSVFNTCKVPLAQHQTRKGKSHLCARISSKIPRQSDDA